MTDNQGKLAGRFVVRQIHGLLDASRESEGRARLAQLRRGLGKAPGTMPELWQTTLSGLPESLYSKDGQPTPGEWAVHIALTLFAFHQQGFETKAQSMNQSGERLGQAVGKLVKNEKDDLPRIKRRFDAAATSDDVAELSNHLRGLVSLLKAAEQPLDYQALAEDLLWFQYPAARDRVRLRWGQDFYGQINHGKHKSEVEKENEDGERNE